MSICFIFLTIGGLIHNLLQMCNTSVKLRTAFELSEGHFGTTTHLIFDTVKQLCLK